MSGLLLLAVLTASAAAALVQPAPGGHTGTSTPPTSTRAPTASWLIRWRAGWAVLAGAGPVLAVGGVAGLLAGLAAAGLCWRWAGHDPGVERRAVEVRRDLPGLVLLVGCALESGCSVADALATAADAHPGPAADALRPAVHRLRLGVEPQAVWGDVDAASGLQPLARALSRSARTGADVSVGVVRLADELAERRRADATDRARRVGVAAAVPLGVCLLPSFLLLGIVPMAVGLVSSLVR